MCEVRKVFMTTRRKTISGLTGIMILMIGVSFLFSGCQFGSTSSKPATSELLVVIDDGVRNNVGGQALFNYLNSQYQVLPLNPAEPVMDVTVIDASAFKGDWQELRNILIVGTMSSNGRTSNMVKEKIGEALMNEVGLENDFYMIERQNEWTKRMVRK